jgi:hypothetical protein
MRAPKHTESTQDFAEFEEFWPYYLGEHASPKTRDLHLLGTAIALACIGGFAKTRDKRWLAGALIGSYGLAWTGHAAFEKNEPATFTHPLWSLRADFRMFRLWLTGGLDPELERTLDKERQQRRSGGKNQAR